MKRLLVTFHCVFLAVGCANHKAYHAYDEDNACMKLCYGDNPLCQAGYTGHPADLPMSIFGQDTLTYAFCLALLDGCKESCGLRTEDEDSDLEPEEESN